MLSPAYLDALAGSLTALWRQAEDDMLRDAARRFGGLAPAAGGPAWRRQAALALRGDIARTLAQYGGRGDAEMRRLLQQAGRDALAADDALYRAAGLAPTPADRSPALLNLLNAGHRQTQGAWRRLTATTADTVTRQFADALDRAWMQARSGAFGWDTAMKNAVDGLARDMKYITYPGGRRDTLEAAARRCALTGANQTCAKLQLARADELGCAFLEVTAHAGARPSHAAWQGKVYHRGGAVTQDGVRYEDFAAATGYGSAEGLCGWNCRHNFRPFFPGASQRAYTDEELARLADDAEYQQRQQQRALERKARAARRVYEAEDAVGLDAAAARARWTQAQRELEAWKKEAARVGAGGVGRSEAANATWIAKREVEKYSAVHYNKDGTVVVTDDWTRQLHPHIPRTYKPNAVVDSISLGGKQHDRTVYDSEGRLSFQIHGGDHGHPKQHPYGQHGEHVHTYTWKDGASEPERETRDLSDNERLQNADIAGGDNGDS